MKKPNMTTTNGGLSRRISAYFRLTQPKIVLLLLVSTVAAMYAAGGTSVPWTKVVATLLGGALCAGGAKSMNAYLDRERDSEMWRTRSRPLVVGEISPQGALTFSIIISLVSLLLFLWIHPLTVILAAAAWVYYVLLYSVYLKTRTSHNVVIGGAAGAFPPLIGWTAAVGHIELAAVFLFLIVFVWTPPHAWALMMVVKNDYRKVNIPMLPAIKNPKDSSKQILLYSVILILLTVVPAALQVFGFLYLIIVLILGGPFLWMAFNLYKDPQTFWARRLYRYSTYYLALLFVGLVLDRMVVL